MAKKMYCATRNGLIGKIEKAQKVILRKKSS